MNLDKFWLGYGKHMLSVSGSEAERKTWFKMLWAGHNPQLALHDIPFLGFKEGWTGQRAFQRKDCLCC